MRIKCNYVYKASAVPGTKLMLNMLFLPALVNSQTTEGL